MIRTRKVSPVEVVGAFLARIESLNPKLNAYLTVVADNALDEAVSAEQMVTAGADLPPLHGVPVSIKDLILTRGIRTTWGSQVYRDFVPDEDEIGVGRLREAGAIILGKTNAPEFGLLAETKNALAEDCRNPWNTSRTTGGSSGGSAAAIASGMTPLSMGNDSAGSINHPASLCGVYGLKPSYGRIPLWPSLDYSLFNHSGPITRTVEDAAVMLSVMSGYDARDPLSIRERLRDFRCAIDRVAPSGRIAWSPDLQLFPIDAEVKDVAYAAATVFQELGFNVEEASPRVPHPFEMHWTIAGAELFHWSGHLLQERPDELEPDTRLELERGMRITCREYLNALHDLWAFRSSMADFFEDYELLLTPSAAVAAFPCGQLPTEINGSAVEPDWMTAYGSLVCWSTTGQPAASVPCGFTEEGLPVGLLIVGRMGCDDTVLAASAMFERARPWASVFPPIALE